jgi:hypothetical protein
MIDGGSPINAGGKNLDDDLDFEKEILDAANQSMMGGDPVLERSRIDSQPVAKRPPPPPPKAPVLSFSEMIAQAAANLKKDAAPATGAPKKDPPAMPGKGPKAADEPKRMSNLDALK